MSAFGNTTEVELALGRLGQNVRMALVGELDVLAQMAARRMKINAPKFRSTLANSVHVIATSQLEREIAPGVDYAQKVTDGIKPGGRGLPRFFDPKSASIMDWLQSHPRGGGTRRRQARNGSRAFTAAMLDLRDRYEGLAWFVRRHGIKGNPFVQKTYDEMQPLVRPRLMAAVQAAMTASAQAGGMA